MSKWETVKLGDVCEILDNLRVPITASERKSGIYPYYGANGIQDYVEDYIFDDELVLLAEDGGNFGSKDKTIAYRVSGKCWVNNHAHVLRPKEAINVDYLCYSIMFYDVMPLISGTTRAKLNQAAMRKMSIPLPPLETQQKIADVLDRAGALIEKRKAQIEKLDLLIKSQFIEMFGDPVTNPKGWEQKHLADVAPTKPFKGKFDEHVWLLNLDLIEPHTGKIIEYSYVNIDKVGDSTCTFNEENVLYSKLRPYLNKVVLPDRIGYGTSELIPLKPFSVLNRIFLAHLLRSSHFVAFINNKVAGAKMPRVSMQDFRDFNCILPPFVLQTQFADFVQQVEAQKSLLQQSLEKLELNYKSLMQKCFRGDLF